MIIRVATFLVVAVSLNSVHAQFGQAYGHGEAEYPQERYVNERFTPVQYEQERYSPVHLRAKAQYPHERYTQELYTPAKYAQERSSTANYAQERLSTANYAQERRSTAKYAQERYGATHASAQAMYPQERYSQERHPGHATSQYTQERYSDQHLAGPAGDCNKLVGDLEATVTNCWSTNQFNFAHCVNQELGINVVDASGGLNMNALLDVLDQLDSSVASLIGQNDLRGIIPTVKACFERNPTMIFRCLKQNVCNAKFDFE